LCTRLRTFALASPMLRINCPVFQPLVWPPTPLFSPSLPQMQTFTITEDINIRNLLLPGTVSVSSTSTSLNKVQRKVAECLTTIILHLEHIKIVRARAANSISMYSCCRTSPLESNGRSIQTYWNGK
jgi:hypothetical protein